MKKTFLPMILIIILNLSGCVSKSTESDDMIAKPNVENDILTNEKTDQENTDILSDDSEIIEIQQNIINDQLIVNSEENQLVESPDNSMTEDESETKKESVSTDDGTQNDYILFPDFPDPYSIPSENSVEIFFSENINALYNDACVIITGKVISEEETVYSGQSGNYNIALSDIEVEQVLKGDISNGDIVTVSETGLRDGEYDRFSIDGVPLLRKDMKVLLFLSQEDGSGSYGIVDVWGGKFFYDNDGLVHASTEFIINGHHPALDIYDFPMAEDEFLQLIINNK